MKKLKNILKYGLIAVLFMFPLFTYADYFKPATLFKNNDRVAVYQKSQADKLFSLGYKLETSEPMKLGIAIPNVAANFETSLVSPLSSTATSSMTLVNGTTDDGTLLSGLYGFTIDAGSSNQEYILATCSGTTCSGLIRGISVTNGSVTVSSLQKSHRRGASVKITDHPIIVTLIRILNGQESTPGGLTFGTSTISGINSLALNGTITGLTTPSSISTSSAANVDYVNKTAIAGGVAGSETNPGVWMGATQNQMSSKTATSSYSGTDYNLVLQSKYASSTSAATTTIPITNTSGKLDTSFIDQAANYNFTGFVDGIINYFGSGADGDVTLTSSSTLARDMYYNNLTVTSTAVLNPGGYRIFVKGTLTIATGSSIARIGNNGTAGNNGSVDSAGGAGGSALASGSIYGALGGANGGTGGRSGGAGSAGQTGTSTNPSLTGVNGVAGGDGGYATDRGVGGSGGTSTIESAYTRVGGQSSLTLNASTTLGTYYLLNGATSQLTLSGSSSSGGGGGGGTQDAGSHGGGGGGAGGNGGIVYIHANTINNQGTISVAGGNGGNGGSGTTSPNAGGGGGGGGGNGGLIVLMFKTMTAQGTLAVTAGAKGTGGSGPSGAGSDGTIGNAGKYILIQL